MTQSETPTTTGTVAYRKTRDGEWAAYGAPGDVHLGEITVTKKSGEAKTENVIRVSQPFNTDDGLRVYGYLGARKPAARPAGARGGRFPAHRAGGCLDCGRPLTDFDRRAASVPGYHFDCA
jgi:hypothetical protein